MLGILKCKQAWALIEIRTNKALVYNIRVIKGVLALMEIGNISYVLIKILEE